MKLSLFSLDKTVIDGWEVQEIYFPGPKGETGVLRGHAPMLSLMTVGEMRFVHATKKIEYFFAISHGFIRVLDDVVVACSYTVEQPHEIDTQRAADAQREAEAKLQEPIASSREFRKYELKLQRSLIRQSVAKHKHGQNPPT
jgi:F-type H+-transporting ATPase subunit epsilon